MGSPPRIPRARPGRAPSVYATHIKITGFSIVKIKRVTVRLGKVTSGLAVGIWVGFGLTLGLKKNRRK